MGSTDLSQSAQCNAGCCCSVSWAASFDKCQELEKEWYPRGRCWVGRNKSGPGETLELNMCCSGEL